MPLYMDNLARTGPGKKFSFLLKLYTGTIYLLHLGSSLFVSILSKCIQILMFWIPWASLFSLFCFYLAQRSVHNAASCTKTDHSSTFLPFFQPKLEIGILASHLCSCWSFSIYIAVAGHLVSEPYSTHTFCWSGQSSVPSLWISQGWKGIMTVEPFPPHWIPFLLLSFLVPSSSLE